MEMESYYDSDEEIAWGPLTLNEIKREFERKPRRVLQRQTAIRTCDYSASVTAADTTNTSKFGNKSDIQSLCDLENIQQTHLENTLFMSHPDRKTPQKPQQTELSDEQSSSDLDEVIVVSDNNSENLPEPESIPDVYSIKPKTRSNSSQLQNFNYSSPQDKEMLEESSDAEDLMFELNRVKEKLAEYQKSDYDKTFLPENEDREIDGNHSAEINNSESPCEEMGLPNEVIGALQIAGSDTEGLQIANPESKVQEKLHHYVEEKVAHQLEKEQDLEQGQQIKDNQSSTEDIQEKINLLGLEANQLYPSIVSSPTINSPKDLLSLKTRNKFLINPAPSSASTVSEDSMNKSDILKFNDTLEEIEMALQQGLNYVMPEEQRLNSKSALEVPSNLNCQQDIESAKSDKKKPLRTPTSKKYDYVQSLVGDYIRKKNPSGSCDNFKVPIKPTKSKLTPIRSPLIQRKPYKNIVSPVGVYIKNSPGVVLKKNVKAKTVSNLNIFPPTQISKSNKENVSSGLPPVICKTATKVTVCEKKEILLPPSIRKLITEPLITKHEKRRNQRDLSEASVNRRFLEEEDLTSTTVDPGFLNQTDGNVSLVTTKQDFIM